MMPTMGYVKSAAKIRYDSVQYNLPQCIQAWEISTGKDRGGGTQNISLTTPNIPHIIIILIFLQK
jgi:hypothetical protein